jgi:hypothetical protein
VGFNHNWTNKKFTIEKNGLGYLAKKGKEVFIPKEKIFVTLLTLLSLTSKVALTVTAPGMLEALTSVATGFTPLVMGPGNVFW